MQDQTNDRGCAEGRERVDAAVLRLLLAGAPGAPMSERELVRALGDRAAVTGSLGRLQRAGLVHRCGELVFSTARAREEGPIPGPLAPASRAGESAMPFPRREPCPWGTDDDLLPY